MNGPCIVRSRPATGGFTIVELMVVVTIIVVLLALLMPAMGRAMYQASLAKCGANQRMVATAAIAYASSNKRFYPARPLPIGHNINYYAPGTIFSAEDPTYDLRPILRDKMGLSVNKNTQCPLIEAVDLEDNLPNEILCGNQSLWFGWRYATRQDTTVGSTSTTTSAIDFQGMDAIGDRFEAPDPVTRRVSELNFLVSDYDNNLGNSSYQGSHPDSKSMMYNWVNKRTVFVVPSFTITISLWQSTQLDRGTLDLNFCYDDASVRRFDRVPKHNTWETLDERMVRVPNERESRSGILQVPRR